MKYVDWILFTTIHQAHVSKPQLSESAGQMHSSLVLGSQLSCFNAMVQLHIALNKVLMKQTAV